jgi:uncharacterized protein (TIGR03663 family)
MLEQSARPSTLELPGQSWLDRSLLGKLAINWELVAYATLFLLAMGLRWAFLDNKPFHHDESQHAYFSYQLYRGNGYAYDPLLHGPFQFETTALMYLIFGPNEFAARLGDTLFGITLVGLPFFLRRQLGKAGALILTAAIALSPTFVYFGRWEREDAFVTFWTMLLFVLFFNFLDRPSRPLLVALGASWAFAFSVKESTFITAFIFGLFVLATMAYEYVRLPAERQQALNAFRQVGLESLLYAAAAFAIVFTVLFSTFFTHPTGVWDGLTKSISYWLAQHDVKRGGQPWFYYVQLLPAYEPLAVVFGIAGGVLALLRWRTRFALFLTWYSIMSLIIYSWAGEKMPWLTLQMLIPLMTVAALALGHLWETRPNLWRTIGLTLAGLLGLYIIHSMTMLTFVNAANPVEMYVYVQTSWDVETAVGEIQGLQRRYANTNAGNVDDALRVDIDSYDGSDWPWAWYLRDAKGIQYPRMDQPNYVPQAPVLIVTAGSNDRIAPQLSGYIVRRYKMREWWIPEPRMPWNFGLWFKWLMWRQPWSPLGSWDVFMYVRPDVWNANAALVPVGGPQVVAQGQPAAGALPAASAVAPEGIIGKKGDAPGDLQGPRQLTFDAAGNLYVVDVSASRLTKYGPNGAVLATYGSKGPGDTQLTEPGGVAVDPNGNVFIADTWNHRIVELNAQLQFVRKWGQFIDLKGKLGDANSFYGPRSVATDANGNVYVADTGNKRIVKFNNNGEYVAQWGGAGSGPGQFQEPVGVALDTQGNIYVSDTWNRRVQKLDQNGKFVAQWPMVGWTPQVHTEPYIVVAGPMLYVTDSNNNRVIGIDTDSNQITQVYALKTVPQFSFPTGIALGRDGKLYISDANNGRIVVLSPGVG